MSHFKMLPLLLVVLTSAAGADPAPEQTLDALYPGDAAGQPARCRAQLAGELAFISANGRQADGEALCQALAGFSPDAGPGRNLTLSTAGDTAWFDERLAGPAGESGSASGVLVLRDGRWLVAQYHLSLAPVTGTATGLMAEPASPAAAPTATPDDDAAAGPACRKFRHKTNKVATC